MLLATLLLAFRLQSPITDRDVQFVLQAVIDSSFKEIAALVEPTVASRTLYMDPARIASAAQEGVAASLFRDGVAVLPSGVKPFDEKTFVDCDYRRLGREACRSSAAVYWLTKKIILRSTGEIEVSGALDYALTHPKPGPSGTRLRMSDMVRARLHRSGGAWRVHSLGVLRPG